MTGLLQPPVEFTRLVHRYDDEERTDGLKRLIAGRDIPRWNVPKGKRGGLVSDSSVIRGDAWVDAESTVRDSVISGAVVRNSKITASQVSGSNAIQSSTVHASFLTETGCDRAHIRHSILFWCTVTRDTSFAPEPLTRAGYGELPEVENSVLMSARISGNSSLRHSNVNGAGIHASEISKSTLDGSKTHASKISKSTLDGSDLHHASVSNSVVRYSYLHDRVVRGAKVSRLSKDAQIGQIRFPSKQSIDRSAALSGGYFDDFPAQIDIWPKLPGRVRQIAILGWIVGVPWAFWTTPLLSGIVAVPLLALVGLRLASGFASRIIGKLEARPIAKEAPRWGRLRGSAALRSCSVGFSSLKKLLNGLLLAGTVLVPTAVVSAAVVERMLNSDAEPSQTAEVVDSVSADVDSDTVVSDDFDRDASSSTISSEPAVPTPVAVTSSNLRAVAYDPEHSYLYVWFHSGGLYRYGNVPETVYRDLLAASSKGRFHASYIRDQYTSVRLS
ncbi:MAG: KTSC domain-containing protein [Acidimicrobiaceae bacterium]|nr:KTSC domain-containing protein [Acidimicrobiaceae bacterium]